MLITSAEVYGANAGDLRIEAGRITSIGKLAPRPGERVINARGGAVLPGLHDHHIHLMSYAASLDSVSCGPPDVCTETQLMANLRERANTPGRSGWIRGFRYHESVAGEIDRRWLDRCLPDVPVRIQHRSGRLWIINSAGLTWLAEAAGATQAALLDHNSGRFYDQDTWLGSLIAAPRPPIEAACRQLAAYGVTGITDMTPRNSNATLALFGDLQADGTLLQHVRMAGSSNLTSAGPNEGLQVGETKIHLHETHLPPFERLCEIIDGSHSASRAVAIHCVTETELVFALAALREVSVLAGDRIEHASVTPPALLEQLRELNLAVVTQPNFITERGDAYLADVPPCERGWLYRCRGFLDAGIALAGGTDAPFGDADPWRAMRAAVTRTSQSGEIIGPEERLTPEEALALFLGDLATPTTPRRITVGGRADLCLLSAPWSHARTLLSSGLVVATIRGGELTHDGVNQPPV
jgi:predicted amidohydrolase YtcJ